jgi:hypothetical protein
MSFKKRKKYSRNYWKGREADTNIKIEMRTTSFVLEHIKRN